MFQSFRIVMLSAVLQNIAHLVRPDRVQVLLAVPSARRPWKTGAAYAAPVSACSAAHALLRWDKQAITDSCPKRCAARSRLTDI